MPVMITDVNDMILDDYHKSICFWEEFTNLQPCSQVILLLLLLLLLLLFTFLLGIYN